MKILPPPLWALIFLTALYFLSGLPPFNTLPRFGSGPLGLVLIVLGLLGPFIAIPQFFAAGTQVAPTSETNNKLVISGLYSFTRNPMYLGMVLASLGGAIWFGRPLMYLAPILVFVLTNNMFIPFEEEKMRRQFGAEFDTYTKRVRRWL